MVDNRKEAIIKAAIKVIGRDGYNYAKIYKIAEEAGVGSGVIYSRNFFINKLDLLLSIVLHFWETLNERISDEVKPDIEPEDKLYKIVAILCDLFTKDDDAIYCFKVLHESLPHILVIKEDELKEKRKLITNENRTLLLTLDKIILEGQQKGHFDVSIKANLIRQVLFGSFEFLSYGLYLKLSEGEKIGYNKSDLKKTITALIDKFVIK